MEVSRASGPSHLIISVSLIVDIKLAKMFAEGLRTVPRGPIVSAIDCQSNYDSVTWPSATASLLFADESNLTATLSTAVSSGFTSAIVVSKV